MVFPNPFKDEIILRNMNFVSGEGCQVNIYDLNGTCIWQADFKANETILLSKLTNLPAGLLIMSIRSGGKEEWFKVMKLKL